MEVRPGYKQTEVGDIPEEWDCVAVQMLVDENILEKPLDGNHGNIHPKSSDFVDYGIPFVMANNFVDGQVDLLGCKFITKARAAKLQKGFSIAGDVLLTHKGTVGNTAIVPELNVDFIMLTPQVTYYRLRDPKRLNNGFLRQYFDSKPFQSLFKSLAGGGTRAYLGIVKQLALPIIKPPIEEQRTISAALSDVDALLRGLDRLIAKNRDLKQAAMQQLLTGKTRLPGFRGEWEVKRLGELFEITSSKRVFQSEWKSEGIPFYRARELAVLGEKGRVGNQLFITRSLYEAFKSAHGVPEIGDMLVTGVGTLGKAYVVTSDREFYFKDGNIIWFKTRGSVSPEFLRQLYLTREVMKQITDAAAGTTVGTYTISGAKKTQIPFPPLLEQTAIAAVLSDMDAELSALLARRDKTRDLKQAMMQQLLTGKTRLVPTRDAHA